MALPIELAFTRECFLDGPGNNNGARKVVLLRFISQVPGNDVS
jgi:hypothetical protein